MNRIKNLEFPNMKSILWDHQPIGESNEIGPFPSE